MPHVRVEELVQREKGAPLSDADREELAARVQDARRWLARWAPAWYHIAVRHELPPEVDRLSPRQRELLRRLARRLQTEAVDPEKVQAAIFALRSELGLSAQEAFGAVYVAFLGKDHGPQAGSLLAALDRDFVVRRLYEASGEPVSHAP
jgi:lysyl-tRNA synthetase class 1